MATYELIALNETTKKLLAPTSADTGTIAGNLTLTAGDLTLSEGKLSITDTDNEAALSVTSSAATANAVSITANSLTTGNGVNISSNSATTNSRNLVYIVNDNSAASGTVALRIKQDSANAALAVNVQADTYCLYIDGVTAAGDMVVIDASSLTSGRAVAISSNSSDSSARSLVQIINDHASATGAVCLNLKQDAANAFMNFAGTAGANVTDPISTFVTVPGAIQGWAQIDINGTKRWIPFYADPVS